MKKYNRTIVRLFSWTLLSLLAIGCSDDKDTNYLDDNKFPAPSLTITSPSAIDVVDFGSTIVVTAKSSSEIGLRNIYATEVRETEEGYEEIDLNKRALLKIDTVKHQSELEFELKIAIRAEEAVGLKLVSTDVLTKTTEQIIKFGFLKGVPPKIFTEPIDIPQVELNEIVAVSAVAKSHLGLKSIAYTLIQKRPYKELHPLTYVNFAEGSKQETFMMEVAVDDPRANAIQIEAIDTDGTLKQYLVEIKNIGGVNKDIALILDNIEMAPEWENPRDPTLPYVFSTDGIEIAGTIKHVLSLNETRAASGGTVDFMFANLWRNQENLALTANRGFAFVGADRLGGGPIGRQKDAPWLTTVTKNTTYFKIINNSSVPSFDLESFFANAEENLDTFMELDKLASFVPATNNDKLLQQRTGASSNQTSACNLQLVDGTYIAFKRQVTGGAFKYGIIKVVKAADDTDALIDGCKIGGVTTGAGATAHIDGPGLAGYDYTGVAKLYGRKCQLKIIVQK